MLVFYTDNQCVTQALTVRESNPPKDMCGYPYLQGLLLPVTTESKDRIDSMEKQPQGLAVKTLHKKTVVSLWLLFFIVTQNDIPYPSDESEDRGPHG